MGKGEGRCMSISFPEIESLDFQVFEIDVIFLIELYRLIDQALDKGVKVAVCSTSNEKAVCIIRFIIVIDCVISFPGLKMVKSNYCMSLGFY